jgi:hypothetical protein
MDQISSSYFSMVYGVFITFVVLGSMIVLVMQSYEGESTRPDTCAHPACDDDPQLCPGYQICEKEINTSLLLFELVLILILAVDYAIRMALCVFVPARIAGIIQNDDLGKKDVHYRWYWQLFYYFKLPFNIIDLLASLPIIIVFCFPSFSNGHTIIALALRLFRIGRLLRIAKLPALREGVNMLSETLSRALPALTLLAMILLLKMLLFGQLIYLFERGTYTVNEEYPLGAYLRWNADHSAKEESPFENMFVAMYWAFVTITTVG